MVISFRINLVEKLLYTKIPEVLLIMNKIAATIIPISIGNKTIYQVLSMFAANSLHEDFQAPNMDNG
jgi:hypothetical protein